ncbi:MULTISPECIES: hypothetical protein [Myxococcus]|uniref:hypothetical protein n=1 Tax=Myxococcus TaxID=32 RepID=UPI0011289E6F|nr:MULTISPECIES: hypothetical protein [Myxococcus]QDE84153.1 hypothetical protein BHS07_22780 [Myxococcus xanthus]QDF06014.1 hypothetical protein BHS04_22805 [Myxococcus xanthus]WAM23483.1 hypothetical protein OZ403_23270 [Myxococcus sp. NMCA1]
MFRYRLVIPSSSPSVSAQDEIVVSLNAEYKDQFVPLQFEGPAASIEVVHRAIVDARGYKKRELNLKAKLMPVDLVAAMSSAHMQPFQPQLIEGEDILSRRSPPNQSTEELTRSFGSQFAGWLVVDLPGPVQPSSYEWEILMTSLNETLFEWSFWRPKHESQEQAARALVGPLSEGLAHETMRLRHVYESRPVARRLVPPALTPEQAHEVASVFVEAFDTAGPGDDGAAALIVRLHEKLNALGLMSRRET